MDKRIKSIVNEWLSEAYDQETKDEISYLQNNNPDELTDAFYKTLEFGTGGLRGIMGVGTNRMNKYTVGAATQGLANYLKCIHYNKKLSVAIAFDSRNNSRYFAQITADVFSANNIHCYIFDELRPTPELSFAVRHFACQAGVMITASHNPKEYNGYKAYWNDGGQLVLPHDDKVIEYVNKINSIHQINWKRNEALITIIGKDVDDIYLKLIERLSMNKEEIKRCDDFKIVYTSLHGTGVTVVPQALEKFGFRNVILVEEQCKPDGNFPTLISPNPEEKSALQMALELAEKENADLVMATDPDADRVGVAARDSNGKLMLFNGNMIASIITYYLLSEWQKQKKISENEFIVKTIVTTDLIEKIALDYNVKCCNVLTGFKYIAEKIRLYEGKYKFICGGEESYGFLIDDFVRDKDAVSACCIIAEIAAVLKNQKKTPFDLLVEIYHKYGFFKEEQISITKKGKNGAEEIVKMMKKFREHYPRSINHKKVVKIIDFLYGKGWDPNLESFFDTNLPTADVIQLFTKDNSIITIRPSGTEPKIKFYFSVYEPFPANKDFDEIDGMLSDRIQNIIKSLKIK